MEEKGYEGWAILELMGHRRLAGRVSEAIVAGCPMLRIDVPVGDSFTTQFYSGGSVYAMTPATEETARAVAGSCRVEPVHPWELRGLLAAPATVGPEDIDDDDGDFAG